MKKYLAIAVGVVLAATWACSTDGPDPREQPFGPGGLPPVTSQSQTTAETPQPTPTPTTPVSEGSVTATRPRAEGDRAFSTFTNNKGHTERVGLCSYKSDQPIQLDKIQHLVDEKYVEVKAGKSVTLDVFIDCLWQVDAVEGSGQCPKTSRYSMPWDDDLTLLEAANGDKNCPSHECPRDFTFDLKFITPAEAADVVVDSCPETRRAQLVLGSSFPFNDIDEPKGCSPTGDPKVFDCEWPTPEDEQGFTVNASARGLDDKRVKCADATASFFVKGCTECVACDLKFERPYKTEGGNIEMPDPPEGYYFLVRGKKYPNGGTIAKLEPKCDQTEEMVVELFDESCSRTVRCGHWKFTWKGEPCCDEPTFDNFGYEAEFSKKGLCYFGKSKHCRINPIKGWIDVYSEGEWVLRVKATSRVSEYEADEPDYVKAEAPVELPCNRGTTLNVEYNWKGHGSRYWYFTLHGPKGKYYKSPLIDGGR